VESEADLAIKCGSGAVVGTAVVGIAVVGTAVVGIAAVGIAACTRYLHLFTSNLLQLHLVKYSPDTFFGDARATC